MQFFAAISGILKWKTLARWFPTHTRTNTGAPVGPQRVAIEIPLTIRFQEASGPDRRPSPEEEAFENQLHKNFGPVAESWTNSKIMGLKQSNADGKSRQELARALKPFDLLVLKSEPENQFDSNAIAVMNLGMEMLGYLPRGTAARLSHFFKIKKNAHAVPWVGVVRKVIEHPFGVMIVLMKIRTEALAKGADPK